MKKLSVALVVLLACFSLAYAGTKITDMTAIGSLELTDILEVVDDPGGSPLSRSATFQQVADVVSTDTDIADAISKKHAQNTDTGTTSGTFQIDSGNTGPKIKNNAWVLESRNAADDAYADFVGKDITGETAKLSDLGDGKIPYHVDDATGLTDGPTKTDVDSAVSLKHTQNTDTGTTETSFTIDSGGSVGVRLAATKTSAAISKTIGATGDYATHALAMAACPDLLAHTVTHTIQAGTTLTETCYIQNKHATVSGANYILQAEKYFPTSGSLPTADSATGTTLVDAALATAALGDDYFNGCWIFIVDGTGTDNGYVAITDYTDVSGTVTVASWPGTQPDSTSRYLIVGALVDGENTRNSVDISYDTATVYLYGIGAVNGGSKNYYIYGANVVYVTYCVGYNGRETGLVNNATTYVSVRYSGFVGNNVISSWVEGGGANFNYGDGLFYYCAFSDNDVQGIFVAKNSFVQTDSCFGDGNGVWGVYARYSGQARCIGTECSGSSGDHSNGVGDGSLAY